MFVLSSKYLLTATCGVTRNKLNGTFSAICLLICAVPQFVDEIRERSLLCNMGKHHCMYRQTPTYENGFDIAIFEINKNFSLELFARLIVHKTSS